MEEEIQRRDVEKRGSGVSVETSSSYVKGSTPGQLTRVADLSAHWLDPTLQLPPFLPQDNLSLTGTFQRVCVCVCGVRCAVVRVRWCVCGGACAVVRVRVRVRHDVSN
jgi:hypothetical protein